MSDPQIILNHDPHAVELPDGSTIAAGKKAQAGGPSVRQVLAEPDRHGVEQTRQGGSGNVAETVLPERLVAFDAETLGVPDRHHQAPVGGPKDHRALVPAGLPVDGLGDAQLRNLAEDGVHAQTRAEPDSEIGADGPTLEIAPQPSLVEAEAVSETMMAQMNFLARIAKLKMANDKVRAQLDGLDQPQTSQRR